MHTAELRFACKAGVKPSSKVLIAVYSLLGALERNGQLVPDTGGPVVELPDGYRVFTDIPEATSLRRSRHSKHVHQALRALDEYGMKRPVIRVLGRSGDSRPLCRCTTRRELVLWSRFLFSVPPLYCGDCAGVVPFYRLGFTSENANYEDILYWLNLYRSFDSIWIASGAGAQFAYRQLSRPDSELNKEGLQVCRAIEKQTKKPVYYYLYRWYGRSVAAERKRRCPSCGGTWLQKRPWLNAFDFRCHRCRLVSHIAHDVT